MKSTKIRPPQNAGLIKQLVFPLVFFRFGQRSKVFSYPPVINAEELVCTGSHIDIVRFALRPFLVHESIHRIIGGRPLDKAVHDLEKSLTQVRGAFLGRRYAANKKSSRNL